MTGSIPRLGPLLASFDRLKKMANKARRDGLTAPSALTGFVADALGMSRRLMDAGHNRETLRLAAQIKALRFPVRDIDFLRGRAFLGIGQQDAAREALKEELRYFPDNAPARELLSSLDSQAGPAVSSPGTDSSPEFARLLPIVRPYTMLSIDRLRSLYDLALQVCHEDLIGNIVECGVAAGGSSALLAGVLAVHSRRRRWLYAFDSFEGMPDPGEHDIHLTSQGAVTAESTGWGAGTCAAPQDSLLTAATAVGARAIVVPIKGYFNQTLPKMAPVIGPISLLHMDGDWYDSTMDILVHCYNLVVPGGLIQIDDFGFWAGCRKAVLEFTETHSLHLEIEPIDATGVRLRKPRGQV